MKAILQILLFQGTYMPGIYSNLVGVTAEQFLNLHLLQPTAISYDLFNLCITQTWASLYPVIGSDKFKLTFKEDHGESIPVPLHPRTNPPLPRGRGTGKIYMKVSAIQGLKMKIPKKKSNINFYIEVQKEQSH